MVCQVCLEMMGDQVREVDKVCQVLMDCLDQWVHLVFLVGLAVQEECFLLDSFWYDTVKQQRYRSAPLDRQNCGMAIHFSTSKAMSVPTIKIWVRNDSYFVN